MCFNAVFTAQQPRFHADQREITVGYSAKTPRQRLKSAAASAAVVVAAATAAVILRIAAVVAAAAAEQQDKDDDPAAAVTAKVKTTHNEILLEKICLETSAPPWSFRFTVHIMPMREMCYSKKLCRCLGNKQRQTTMEGFDFFFCSYCNIFFPKNQ